jgi:hypothetical protein
VKFEDSALKISLNAPPDWLFDAHKPDDAKSPHKIFILDPEATATSELSVQSQTTLTDDQKKSVRAWADAEIADGAKMLKDLKVRSDSWKERTIAGKPGLSVIADFTEGKVKKTAYAVFSLAAGNAVQFLTYAASGEFEEFRPKFEAIIDSFKVTP